jgi:hypothetical protein
MMMLEQIRKRVGRGAEHWGHAAGEERQCQQYEPENGTHDLAFGIVLWARFDVAVRPFHHDDECDRDGQD